MPEKRPSPEGTAESIPQITFIVGDVMFLKQGKELFLECHLSMMDFLSFDILDGFVQWRYADTERSILRLPPKESVLGEGAVHPFRRTAFDQLQRFGD